VSSSLTAQNVYPFQNSFIVTTRSEVIILMSFANLDDGFY